MPRHMCVVTAIPSGRPASASLMWRMYSTCWRSGSPPIDGDVLALVRVVQVREARVVELEVRAAELAEAADLLAVRGGQVGPERVQVGVDARGRSRRAPPR